MKYIQLDNFLSPTIFKRLQLMTGGENGFPWYFLSKDVAYATDGYQFGNMDILDIAPEQKTVGFTHVLLDQGGIESPWLVHFQPLLDCMQDAIGHDINFLRVRLALQLANGKDSHNAAHTDWENDHYAALFYLNNSSGDTVFFDQYDDPNEGTVDERWYRGRTQEYTERHRVTPEENKLFIFDGHQYHSSSNPVDNPYRIICNFNFTCDHDIFDHQQTQIL